MMKVTTVEAQRWTMMRLARKVPRVALRGRASGADLAALGDGVWKVAAR